MNSIHNRATEIVSSAAYTTGRGPKPFVLEKLTGEIVKGMRLPDGTTVVV